MSKEDSLILVFLTKIPNASRSTKGKGVDKAKVKELNKSDMDLIKVGRSDIKLLENAKFEGDFKDAQVCKEVIYLGSDDKKHSLKSAISNFLKNGGKLKNLAINISGHGALDVIGGEAIDEEADIGPKTLAKKINEYLNQSFDELGEKIPENGINFYIRTCNSGYPNPNKDKSREDLDMFQTFAENSFAGTFALKLRRILKKSGNDMPFKVSGFVGYLSQDTKNDTISDKLGSEGGLFETSDCRVVFDNKSINQNLIITLPENGQMIEMTDLPNETKSNASQDSIDLDYYNQALEDFEDGNLTDDDISEVLSKSKKEIKKVSSELSELEKEVLPIVKSAIVVAAFIYFTLKEGLKRRKLAKEMGMDKESATIEEISDDEEKDNAESLDNNKNKESDIEDIPHGKLLKARADQLENTTLRKATEKDFGL